MARLSLASIRESVKLMVASSPQIQDADVNLIIKHAHRTLASSFQWSFRKRDTLLQTLAPYSTGTVTVTLGSPTVTGASTVWTAAMVGSQIRIQGELMWFWINAVDPVGQTLTLADGNLKTTNWVVASAAAQTYTIFKDQFPVPADVALILNQVRDWPIDEASLGEVDTADPRRTATAATPNCWYWARDAILSGVEQRFVGLWPVPASAITLRMPYLIEPPDMLLDADLPVCPSEILELRAGSRACLFIHARTGDQRWAAQAMTLETALMGTPGLLGQLQQSLQDDSHRFGLPTRLGGTRLNIGYDRLGQRDWAL